MRLSFKQLEAIIKERANANGLEYGHGKGKIQLVNTDARCAPYNYALELGVNDGGAVTRLIDASAARQMYDLIYDNGWIETAKRRLYFIEHGKYPA